MHSSDSLTYLARSRRGGGRKEVKELATGIASAQPIVAIAARHHTHPHGLYLIKSPILHASSRLVSFPLLSPLPRSFYL